jgi:hypothetical protein
LKGQSANEIHAQAKRTEGIDLGASVSPEKFRRNKGNIIHLKSLQSGAT